MKKLLRSFSEIAFIMFAFSMAAGFFLLLAALIWDFFYPIR
jgi:hypothetical protein